MCLVLGRGACCRVVSTKIPASFLHLNSKTHLQISKSVTLSLILLIPLLLFRTDDAEMEVDFVLGEKCIGSKTLKRARRLWLRCQKLQEYLSLIGYSNCFTIISMITCVSIFLYVLGEIILFLYKCFFSLAKQLAYTLKMKLLTGSRICWQLQNCCL